MEVGVISELGSWFYIREVLFLHAVQDFIGFKRDAVMFHTKRKPMLCYDHHVWKIDGEIFEIVMSTWNRRLARKNGYLHLHLSLEVLSWKSPALKATWRPKQTKLGESVLCWETYLWRHVVIGLVFVLAESRYSIQLLTTKDLIDRSRRRLTKTSRGARPRRDFPFFNSEYMREAESYRAKVRCKIIVWNCGFGFCNLKEEAHRHSVTRK